MAKLMDRGTLSIDGNETFKTLTTCQCQKSLICMKMVWISREGLDRNDQKQSSSRSSNNRNQSHYCAFRLLLGLTSSGKDQGKEVSGEGPKWMEVLASEIK